MEVTVKIPFCHGNLGSWYGLPKSSMFVEVQMASNAINCYGFIKLMFIKWFNSNQEYLRKMDSRIKAISSL